MIGNVVGLAPVESLEEFINSQPYYGSCTIEYKEGIEEGARWQAEKMYSEEEVYTMLRTMPNFFKMTIPQQEKARKEWFEQFKKR